MGDALLELREVTKRFRQGLETVRAVDRVSLSIAHGDFVSIQGPSGSGKSTLLHLMGALDRPSEGRVVFDGVEIATQDDRALSAMRRDRMGFVFQSFNLIPELDVLENVALPLKYAGVSKHERRERARLRLDALGLGHRLGHRPAELSGGEEQRVAIARALVNRPVVLLADEPTGNLDSANRDRLIELFAALHKDGVTVVVVTHDPVVARAAERCLLMQDGRLCNAQ